jgi:DnaJ-class molecular chaperone
MGTTVTERTTDRPTDRAAHRATWSCPNCRGETSTAKKRCRDCGTSRF